MWDEVLGLLQIWDDDEDENWLWINSVEWAGDDMDLSITLAYQDETRHRWEIRCRAVLAYSVVDVRGGGLQLIDDPAHPLVRAYADEHATLYFNGQSSDWFSVLGKLLAAHQVVCGDWAPSTAFMQGGVDLLSGEHGLLAEGPVFVLAAYAEVLDGCGIQSSIVGHRPYRLWNGERFLEPTVPRAIHFGDSWVVANAFEAKDLGAVPPEPTTGVPERYCERHIARSTRARVAEVAGIGDASGMQDWPAEVADPDRTAEFLDLLELEPGADERYAFMELVLYSMDQASDRLGPTCGRASPPS